MQSSEQLHQSSMTQEKPLEGSIPRKAGIAIQSSAPLYAQRHHDHLQPTHHDNGEKVPSVTTNTNLNPYGSGQPNLPLQAHDNSHEHAYHGDNQAYHAHAHHDQAHHDHSQHDHSQHDHSQHNHSQHDHSQHGHHGHNHSQHDHHGHDHLGHDHHGHDHSHHDHGHSHAHQHNYTPVYTRPLPSWIEIFSQLSPIQKTIFTWFLVHSGIGVWLYCMGTSRESLSLVGFSYLVIFDALGVLNSFVSSVLKTNSAFGISNTKRPYGAHRYEIVFALGTTIYLMFATMHNTKESLEHFLLKEHHGKSEVREDHHLKFSLGMFFLVGFALTATCLSCITLRNHDNFVRYLRRRPTTVQGFSYNVINRARGNPIHALLSNVYSLSIALCGSVILITYMFGIATPFVDNFLALSESVVMFYLGYPTAKALAKVLLQTTPNTVQNGVENRLREIQQDPNILHVDRVHFWQTTYGKCIGTIDIQVRSDADEQAVLQLVYQKLEGLTSSDDNESELTVSVFK